MTHPAHSTAQLLQQAQTARKHGNLAQAQALLSTAVRQEPTNASAWLGLAEVVADPAQKQQCYERVLQLDPANRQAQLGLQRLHQSPAHPAATGPTIRLRSPQQPIPHQPQTAQPPTQAGLAPGSLQVDLNKGLLRGNVALKQWFAAIDSTQTMIQAKQKQRFRAFAVAVASLVLVVPGIIFAVLPLIIIGLLIALVAAVVGLQSTPKVALHASSRRTAHTALHSSVIPFLKLLSDDIDRAKPVLMMIDLSGYKKDHKLQQHHTQELSKTRKIKESTYVDPWFTGSAHLLDGTLLRWNVTAQTRERLTTKRNPRGKIKTKTKKKVKHLIKTQLQLRGVYQPRQQALHPPAATVRYDPHKQKLMAQQTLVSQDPHKRVVLELLQTIGDMYRFVQTKERS